MDYHSGKEVLLGDIVEFDVGPNELVSAQVVMLGTDYSHSGVDAEFLRWVITDKVLEKDSIVVEIESKEGNYMFTSLCCVQLLNRASA